MAYKMALVVRTDLGMGKGKIAAQCGHAVGRLVMKQSGTRSLMDWLADSPPEMKIVLKVGSEKELIDISEHCRKLGLQSSLIADAGHTQVEPGSITVLGIGPDTNERIHEIVGHLKLL